MTIHVRVFAALRELAGTSQLEASGRTVGEVSDALSAVQGERFAQIAAVSTFVVNGDRATRDTLIAHGDEVANPPPGGRRHRHRRRGRGGDPPSGQRRLTFTTCRVAGVRDRWDTPAMRFHRVLLVVNPVARTVAKPTLAVIEKALSADFALEVAETKEKGHASGLP